jgi:hypothetical protein
MGPLEGLGGLTFTEDEQRRRELEREPVAHPKAVTMGRAAIGIDIGQKRDPTAVAVVEAKEREDPQTGAMADHYVTRHVERLALGTAYPAVAQRLSAIVENVQTRARPQDRLTPPIWLDATGVGQPVVDLRSGSAWSVPRWSMKMIRRSALIPSLTTAAATASPVPPGPPSSQRRGAAAASRARPPAPAASRPRASPANPQADLAK